MQTAVGARCRRVLAHQLLEDRCTLRQFIEIFSGAGILRRAPCMNLRIRGVLKPAIRIGDRYAVIEIAHGVLVGHGRTWVGSKRGPEGDEAAQKEHNSSTHLLYFHGER